MNCLICCAGPIVTNGWPIHQYWLGAKLVKGPMKGAVGAELLQHATEELLHADMVAMRIIQLGGTPANQTGRLV